MRLDGAQGEAPPGAIFTQFKNKLDAGGVASEDIAFYFVHWLTDLGGAEPTPERGVEKFVLKFPHAVFHSLVGSIEFVTRLAQCTPAELFLSYLRHMWAEGAKGVKGMPAQPPTGPESLAYLRLLAHAQSASERQRVVEALPLLPAEARAVLSVELALTGCARTPSYAETPEAVGGPALLGYYAPAFVRLAADDDAAFEKLARKRRPRSAVEIALRMLAAIYLAARTLWPRTEADGGRTATLHLKEIKSLPVWEIIDFHQQGGCWVLTKTTPKEAEVQRTRLDALVSDAASRAAGTQAETVVLPLWAAAMGTLGTGAEDEAEGSATSEASPIKLQPPRQGTAKIV